jgi:hypothetical protein
MIGKYINKNGRRKKIALCFLTYDGHAKGDVWTNNINKSKNKHYFNFYVHNKNDIPVDDFLKTYEIPDKIDTQWADISLVRATLLLFKEALKDPDNEYFILLSDKCIPIYNLDFIYDMICTSSYSILDISAGYNPLHDKYRKDRLESVQSYVGHSDNFKKSSQWMCLTKKDASFFVDNDYTEVFKDCWAVDEHYFCNIIHKNNIKHLNRVITFANWNEPSDNPKSRGGNQRDFPKTHNSLSIQQIQLARNTGAFFMRKIPKHCVICHKALSLINETFSSY